MEGNYKKWKDRINSKQDRLSEDNVGEFMDSELATKSTPNSGDTVLGRDSVTGKAVKIPTSSLGGNGSIDVSNYYTKNETFSGTAIDSKIATAKTEVKNEILGSASAAYDTLQEIQAQMEADDTAAAALTTAVGQRPTYTETGNLDTDLVQLYNTAKA